MPTIMHSIHDGKYAPTKLIDGTRSQPQSSTLAALTWARAVLYRVEFIALPLGTPEHQCSAGAGTARAGIRSRESDFRLHLPRARALREVVVPLAVRLRPSLIEVDHRLATRLGESGLRGQTEGATYRNRADGRQNGMASAHGNTPF